MNTCVAPSLRPVGQLPERRRRAVQRAHDLHRGVVREARGHGAAGARLPAERVDVGGDVDVAEAAPEVAAEGEVVPAHLFTICFFLAHFCFAIVSFSCYDSLISLYYYVIMFKAIPAHLDLLAPDGVAEADVVAPDVL